MGSSPSISPVYDDKGNQTGTIENGLTESQKKNGKTTPAQKVVSKVTGKTKKNSKKK